MPFHSHFPTKNNGNFFYNDVIAVSPVRGWVIIIEGTGMEEAGIYIDMVFIVNYMMDFLLLSLLKEILQKDSGIWRRCVGAAVGALWACLAVMMPLPGFMQLAGSLGIAAGMVAVAFRERGADTLFFSAIGLLFLSMTLSGLVSLVSRFTGLGYAMELSGVPSWFLLPVLAGGMMAVVRISRNFWRYQGTKRQLWKATLKKGGKELTLTGFVDTGNRLYEPYRGRPVHIVSADCLGDFLAGNLAEDQGFLYIPYHSVGNAGGLLKGFQADEMILYRQGCRVDTKKPVVAITKESLDCHGMYQMLLHPDILTTGKKPKTQERQ